jgi:preprotein translocase subunit YajC
MEGLTYWLAMMAPGGAGSGQGGSPLNMLMPMIIIFAIFYFMLIRPQQRKEKERQLLISNVKSGDRVIFSGGIVGTVSNVKEKSLIVKIADNTKVEILRGAVSSVLDKGDKIGVEETK